MSKKESEGKYDLLLPGVVELRLVPTPPKLLPVFTLSQQCAANDAVGTCLFLVETCSANTSTQCFALNSRIKRGSLCVRCRQRATDIKQRCQRTRARWQFRGPCSTA